MNTAASCIDVRIFWRHERMDRMKESYADVHRGNERLLSVNVLLLCGLRGGIIRRPASEPVPS